MKIENFRVGDRVKFDLESYTMEDICIAIGLYRPSDGDYEFIKHECYNNEGSITEIDGSIVRVEVDKYGEVGINKRFLIPVQVTNPSILGVISTLEDSPKNREYPYFGKGSFGGFKDALYFVIAKNKGVEILYKNKPSPRTSKVKFVEENLIEPVNINFL